MINSNFTGETMIFRNDKGFYSTTISKKNQDGTYDKAYVNLGFKKGLDIPNKTLIDVKKGFLTFDKYEKDGKSNTFLKIFVSEYEVTGNTSSTSAKSNDTFSSTDDLPF